MLPIKYYQSVVYINILQVSIERLYFTIYLKEFIFRPALNAPSLNSGACYVDKPAFKQTTPLPYIAALRRTSLRSN